MTNLEDKLMLDNARHCLMYALFEDQPRPNLDRYLKMYIDAHVKCYKEKSALYGILREDYDNDM